MYIYIYAILWATAVMNKECSGLPRIFLRGSGGRQCCCRHCPLANSRHQHQQQQHHLHHPSAVHPKISVFSSNNVGPRNRQWQQQQQQQQQQWWQHQYYSSVGRSTTATSTSAAGTCVILCTYCNYRLPHASTAGATSKLCMLIRHMIYKASKS